MPNRNGGLYIETTIASILSQTYKDFRVLIVDNASTDNSIGIARSFNDTRIELKLFSEPVSLPLNLNRCLDLVRAPFFCIMHTDDVYETDYIENLVGALANDASALAAYCDVVTINDKGVRFTDLKYLSKRTPLKSALVTVEKGAPFFCQLLQGNYIIAPSLMYRREVVRNIGTFNSNYKFVLDWEYTLRILLAGASILKVNKALFLYRIHGRQQTQGRLEDLTKYSERLDMVSSLRDRAKTYFGDTGCLKKFRNDGIYTGVIQVMLWDASFDLSVGNISEAIKKLRFAEALPLSRHASYYLRIFRTAIKFGRMGGFVLRSLGALALLMRPLVHAIRRYEK